MRRLWYDGLKCPKVKFFGLFRVLFLVRHTALEHNYGYSGATILQDILGSDEGLENYQRWKDEERSRHATTRPKERKRRKQDDDYRPGEY